MHFLKDKDGVNQKDYIIVFTTAIYAIIIIFTISMVLLFPQRYSIAILDFILEITRTSSTAYAVIVTFFFASNKTSEILKYFKNNSKEKTAKEEKVNV
jgi:hypothetical protein